MTNSITHRVLDWNEEKFDELLVEDETPSTYAKAFLSGALDGLIDAATMVGLVVIGTGTWCIVKSIFTKK